ncbi:MAG: DNA polymerase III subunit beta [Planctomycetota bacterium]
MKVTCDRGALAEAIGLVSSVVAARTPRPQLRCVKITAETVGKSGRLTLAATDAEISIELRLEMVAVEQEGACLVPADKLSQIVRAEDTDPTLALEADGDITHIRGADAHFQLRGFPADEFPDIPGPESAAKAAADQKSGFTHNAGELDELIRKTVFATARENSRYAINGVLLNRNGKTLECVATDGRRLALARTSLDDAGGEPISVIAPAKALNMLQRLIGDADEPISVSTSDNRIVFALGLGLAEGGPAEDCRAVLACNLVEGTFPPYEDVIPKDQDIKVGFDRDVLASAVRRAALLTNEESRGVRMAFTGDDKKLELSSRVPEMGEARIGVDLASFDGTDIEIGFNPAFITDALKVVDQPDVLLELKAANKPGLFKAGPGFTYVVMPVNLT